MISRVGGLLLLLVTAYLIGFCVGRATAPSPASAGDGRCGRPAVAARTVQGETVYWQIC